MSPLQLLSTLSRGQVSFSFWLISEGRTRGRHPNRMAAANTELQTMFQKWCLNVQNPAHSVLWAPSTKLGRWG